MIHDRVTARLWEVLWYEGGIGKHGRGPFATPGQAARCICAVGFPGEVVPVTVTLDRGSLARIMSKLKTGIPGRRSPLAGAVASA